MTHFKWFDAKDLSYTEPSLGNHFLGAALFARDGALHPLLLMKALKLAVLGLGAEIWDETDVARLIVEGRRVTGVLTSRGAVYARDTVIAAGAWSAHLLDGLGLTIPVRPLKGEMIAVGSPPSPIWHILQGPGGMLIPRPDGSAHVGVTVQEAGLDRRCTLEGIQSIYTTVKEWAPWLATAELRAS